MKRNNENGLASKELLKLIDSAKTIEEDSQLLDKGDHLQCLPKPKSSERFEPKKKVCPEVWAKFSQLNNISIETHLLVN